VRISYFVIVLSVIGVAWAGNYFTTQGLPSYLGSRLPALAPPGWFIGAVWMLIYALSALALILWFARPERDARFWLVVWLALANGVLNASWCWLFFTMRWVGAAIAEMLVLEATVLALIALMWRPRRAAALLLTPYAAWVVFATYLAVSFWVLNR
jgi:tryptophan-rich sensory protein